MKPPITTWIPLTDLPEERLWAALGQLHQAVQLLTAVGISYLDPRSDDSHTALKWNTEKNEFLSQPFGLEHSFQLALNPIDLKCQVYHDQTSLIELKLNGTTLRQVASDLQFFLEDQGFPKQAFTMERHFELPDYPDHWSSAFDLSDQAAFALVASAYTNAYSLLVDIAHHDHRAGNLLTWPHHFDMAVLLTLAEGKSIGIGMSPGDSSYSRPYYYVNAWPSPDPDQIANHALKTGKWHTEGWVGMVLPLDQILQKETGRNQAILVQSFLSEAISHAESICGEKA